MAGNANVSVIVATYNRAHLITRALDSVARQTEPPGEIVVVDDASQDDTATVVERWAADSSIPVQLVVSPRNRGLGASRNTAMQAARGSLFAPLDSDDEYLPHALATLAPMLDRHPQAVVAFADGLVTFADGRPPHRHLARRLAPGAGTTALGRDGDFRLDSPQEHFLTTSFIPTCSVVFRRSAAEAAGWMPELRYGEDWLFWLRLTELGEFVCRFEDVSIIHRQGDNLTDEANALFNARQITASLASIRRGDHIALTEAQSARLDRAIAEQAAAHRYFASRGGLATYWRELRSLAPETGLNPTTSLLAHPRDLARALASSFRRSGG
ncbi:MAG: glycosyltransferase family 2 protein [Sphingomonadaceae bacterium]|jgi:glycosyltransferase involved in cell wall biosynthesis